MWDEKLLLCYSLLRCKCDKIVGVSVHSSICGDGVESLNGKVSVSQPSISLEKLFVLVTCGTLSQVVPSLIHCFMMDKYYLGCIAYLF